MTVPTKEVGAEIDDDEETVVLRSDQRSSWEKHETQRSMLVSRMNEKGELFLTPANVSHQMRPSFTHIVENGGRSAFKKRHAGNSPTREGEPRRGDGNVTRGREGSRGRNKRR